MPRIRYLKPEFFTDEHIGELSYAERLVFQGLWCHSDREGRLEDKPKFLKVVILPYDEDGIEEILLTLSSGVKPLIHRYEVDGKRYIQIVNFLKHQSPHHTEKDSVIPIYTYKPVVIKDKDKEKEKDKHQERDTELTNRIVTVKTPLKVDAQNDFEIFWSAYPRKVGKGAALLSWNKKKTDIDTCLKALEWQKNSDQWLKDNGQFIPHPSTWINQERWDDGPPKAKYIHPSWIEAEAKQKALDKANEKITIDQMQAGKDRYAAVLAKRGFKI